MASWTRCIRQLEFHLKRAVSNGCHQSSSSSMPRLMLLRARRNNETLSGHLPQTAAMMLSWRGQARPWETRGATTENFASKIFLQPQSSFFETWRHGCWAWGLRISLLVVHDACFPCRSIPLNCVAIQCLSGLLPLKPYERLLPLCGAVFMAPQCATQPHGFHFT